VPRSSTCPWCGRAVVTKADHDQLVVRRGDVPCKGLELLIDEGIADE
jgi:hypothetical protein